MNNNFSKNGFFICLSSHFLLFCFFLSYVLKIRKGDFFDNFLLKSIFDETKASIQKRVM